MKTAEEKLNIPPVRVKHYNEETGKVEYGSVLEVTLNTYLVIPDYNTGILIRWDKKDCDTLR